jgi:hypothetical protein
MIAPLYFQRFFVAMSTTMPLLVDTRDEQTPIVAAAKRQPWVDAFVIASPLNSTVAVVIDKL